MQRNTVRKGLGNCRDTRVFRHEPYSVRYGTYGYKIKLTLNLVHCISISFKLT